GEAAVERDVAVRARRYRRVGRHRQDRDGQHRLGLKALRPSGGRENRCGNTTRDQSCWNLASHGAPLIRQSFESLLSIRKQKRNRKRTSGGEVRPRAWRNDNKFPLLPTRKEEPSAHIFAEPIFIVAGSTGPTIKRLARLRRIRRRRSK